MEKNNEEQPTKAYFVKAVYNNFPSEEEGTHSEILAVFPDIPANPGRVMVYARIGQHGEASLDFIETDTLPATESEYADLKAELDGIYTEGLEVVELPQKILIVGTPPAAGTAGYEAIKKLNEDGKQVVFIGEDYPLAKHLGNAGVSISPPVEEIPIKLAGVEPLPSIELVTCPDFVPVYAGKPRKKSTKPRKKIKKIRS